MTSTSVIVDTNLIFSALIPTFSNIREILLDPSTTFYAPNYLIIEIYKHKEKLIKNSKLDETEFQLYFNGIIEHISFVPIELISIENRRKAFDLCKDVDINDTPFIALALELNLLFWTGDKKLKDGLRNKGFVNFFRE